MNTTKPFSYIAFDVYLSRFVLTLPTEIRIMTAYTPNLPALITALPGDRTRAPQTEFTRGQSSDGRSSLVSFASARGEVRSISGLPGTPRCWPRGPIPRPRWPRETLLGWRI